MNQRQLSYFLEVYKYRSISTAAQKLFISPQGLSKTILSLEEEIGLTLFERNGKKMIPTKAAVNLTSHARNILEEFALIKEQKFVASSIRKTLPICVSYDTLQYIPVTFFHDFNQLYPEILLSIKELPDLEIIGQLNQNQVEIALIPGPLDNMKYDMTYLFSNQFCLLINKQNSLAAQKEISYSDIATQPMVIKSQNYPVSTSQINDFLKHGFTPNILLEVSDSHVIYQMVEKNYAIGMTLDYLVKDKQSLHVAIRPFPEAGLSKDTYLVHKSDMVLSHEAAIFKDFLPAWIAKHAL